MTTIEQITAIVKESKISHLDVEVILAYVLKKSREFILTHPELKISSHQSSVIGKLIRRRLTGEPIAYITGHKEFYGLDFKLNKYTLIPRPETELIVDKTLALLENKLHDIIVIDIGTGSGNIIISLTKNSKTDTKYYAIDISNKALRIAKKNAKKHKADIKFFKGNLLTPIIKTLKLETRNSTIIIVANLPYLSKEIFNAAPIDVKKFEPSSALYSPEAGLKHYRELLEQLKKIQIFNKKLMITALLEISPEQKIPISKLIKNILPKAKIKFTKDLARKWRIAKIKL